MKHTLALTAGSVLLLALIAATPTGTLSGNDGPKEPAAYYLVGGDAASIRKEKVAVEQSGKKFTPELVSVSVGGHVAFPNRDDLMHNVYSPEGPLGFFDMGSAKKTTADNANVLGKDMGKEGAVSIACAIHPIMTGTVFVVPSKYHTTSRDGTYSFSNVPPGSYDLMVMKQKGAVSKLKTVTIG